MNARDVFSHEQAVELLPWLVNDSLDEQEKDAVLEHALACVICRREMTDLEQIRDSVSHDSNSSPVPAPDMRNVNARIDALIDGQNHGQELLSRLGKVFSSRWRIAFVAQTVVLILLASVLLWPEPEGARFSTLTQPDNFPDGRYVRVVFTPDIQQSKMTSLLDKYNLVIVEGPSNRGVYTLDVENSTQDIDRLLSSLQGDPDVLFAQPVANGAGR